MGFEILDQGISPQGFGFASEIRATQMTRRVTAANKTAPW